MANLMSPWMLLPPGPEKCQECAVIHTPDMPHDKRSLYYQYRFYQREGRWPTWEDAMSHCTDQIKEAVRLVAAKLERRNKIL